jgi:leucyl aminopeptidase
MNPPAWRRSRGIFPRERLEDAGFSVNFPKSMLPTNTDVTIAAKPKLPGDSEAAVVFISEDKSIEPAWGKILGAEAVRSIKRLFDSDAASGKTREIRFDLLEGRGKLKRVYVVGVGEAKKANGEIIRQTAGSLCKALKKHGIARAAIVLPRGKGVSAGEGAAAVAEGMLLAGFDYREYLGTASKSKDSKKKKPKPLAVVFVEPGESFAPVKSAVDRARIICEGQNFARTIASRPGNNINPPTLAAEAKLLARETGLGITVFDEKALKRMKMGGILAVGEGSIYAPPRLIVLEHKPKNLPKNSKPILVVGKAITFDTGGISIKPADKMGKMIYDKCGGMAVLGLMYGAAKLKMPAHVVGILSSAENAISSKAYRPGDILRMYNGVTVDVTNTDAEGRLVLADALAWGIEKYKPSAVVDLATLTGGVIVALGKTMAGVMSNNDDLVEDLGKAAEIAGEKIWRLPLGPDQREQIRAEHADIVNSAGREGHPLQGAAFLSYFVPEDDSVPWAHLDIAGVADTEKDLPYYAKGATGWGVRTLINWIEKSK